MTFSRRNKRKMLFPVRCGRPVMEYERETKNAWPQLLLTFVVCMGAFSFGTVLGWTRPGRHQLKDFGKTQEELEWYFSLVIILAPLGATIGVLPWFWMIRLLGPRYTMIVQGPLLLGFWVMQYYSKRCNPYCAARFFLGLFTSSYLFTGQSMLVESVHRIYIKNMYVYFQCSPIAGIVLMNFAGEMLPQKHLGMLCATIPVLVTVLMLMLRESPLFLMQSQDNEARRALLFYRGRDAHIEHELRVLREYRQFRQYRFNMDQLMSTGVVRKMLRLSMFLHFVKSFTGYYALLILCPMLLTKSTSALSPGLDRTIVGCVALGACAFGCHASVRRVLGMRWTLACSFALMSFSLAALGVATLFLNNISYLRLLHLASICALIVSYEAGAHLLPDVILFYYCPHQILSRLEALLATTDWLMVVLSIMLLLASPEGISRAILLLFWSFIAAGGAVAAATYIMEPGDRPLHLLHMALGFNPAGRRGTWRTRPPHPLERFPPEQPHFDPDTLIKDAG